MCVHIANGKGFLDLKVVWSLNCYTEIIFWSIMLMLKFDVPNLDISS